MSHIGSVQARLQKGAWSELNYDVLGEIAIKLDTIEDFVYFSAICRSWNRASSLVKPKWKPSMLCLLLVENCNKNPNFLRKIISLDNDRCYQLRLPHTFGARCWGSTNGWIVTMILRLEIYLYNPFTNSRLRLPPQPTFPNQEPPLHNAEEDAIYKRQLFIRKAIVVKDVESGLIVLAIRGLFLSFARPGDLTWTSIVLPWPLEDNPDSRSHRSVDVMCRDRSILILYDDGSVGYLDLPDLSKIANLEQSVQAKEFLPSPEYFKGRISTSLIKIYFFESFGSLLIVLRYKRTIWGPNYRVLADEYYRTFGFDVFGIDLKTKKWDQVKDLGDVALFVGDSQSISVRASNCRNCKPNCIYFTDDYDDLWDVPRNLGGHDIGFYNLNDGKINEFYKGDDVHSGFCTPFWFVPQF